ncbi:MAG: hypothetical protein KA257_09915 [Opitutaceae bacterium]|nr:hypothetical protein [Opitutaceae bacterium]MBP9912261.1 hypothetical protein [Opitutaceae bacterium]
MKTILTVVFLGLATIASANTAPTAVVTSATMRSGTTFMDVVFRVNDPDDATVKVRALAFKDGVRSFSNIIKPVTFVEGTGTNLGDAITTNTEHTLTWDVAADWNIDLGQLKFEVLTLDGRGLLEVNWIAVPAAGGQPALTISKDTPADAQILDALFWEYAASNSRLSLSFSFLTGNSSSGIYAGVPLALHNIPYSTAKTYLFKQMNLDPASSEELSYAANDTGAGLLAPTGWHAVDRPYAGVSLVFGWGDNRDRQITIPEVLTGVTAVATNRTHSMALKNDGTVVVWGDIYNPNQNATVLAGLSGVTAIAANGGHSLALKSDGTVVAWGYYSFPSTVPAGLSGVTAIAAGGGHDLALKNDDTVVAWGDNTYLQCVVPVGLSEVIAVAAGSFHSLALKSDGTVIAWGRSNEGQIAVPSGLSGVTAIAAGGYHCLALKSDGTVVAWGSGNYGQTTVPPGLTGVIAIAAGVVHSLALKSDGTVIAWGKNDFGQTNAPADLSGVSAIAAGDDTSLVLKNKAP